MKLMEQAFPDLYIIDRARDFYTLLCISCHHISRSNINCCICSFSEDEKSWMLQISSDDTCHTQILCLSLDSREDTADPTHDQIYLHPCLRCFCYFSNEIHVRNRIHFHNDSSVLTFCNFFIHQSKYFLFQTCR